MSVNLHEYARHLLTLPDVEVAVEVTVMSRNPGAPEGTKPFAARVKFFAQCEDETAADKYAQEGWHITTGGD